MSAFKTLLPARESSGGRSELNILIIQILRLGDAVQMIPVIKALKASCCESSINVLCSNAGKEVFEKLPEVDQVFILDKDHVARLVKESSMEAIVSAGQSLEKYLGPVCDMPWDWVINFGFSFSSALIARMARGSHVSGLQIDESRRYFAKEKWFSYGLSAFAHRKFTVFNWVDIYKHILGLPTTDGNASFPVDAKDTNEAKRHLQGAGLLGKRLIGLHPGASGTHKRWPIEKFARLGRSLVVEKGDCAAIVFGNDDGIPLGEYIKSTVGKGCLDLTGKTDLSQLAAYLAECDVLISNDTGPAHVAAAVGTPVLGLYFSTHFVETGPYDAGNIAVYPDVECFPCQGTAKCQSKICLNYIEPETVENIVRASYWNNATELSDMSLSEHAVKVDSSSFDRFGNLEWWPADGRDAGFSDFMRYAYKRLWISTLSNVEDKEPHFSAYIEDWWVRNKQCLNVEEWRTVFEQEPQLNELEAIYSRCYSLSNEIYCIYSLGDAPEAQDLGHELGRQEDALCQYHKNPALSPLIEYIDTRRQNIVEAEPKRMAMRTAHLYHEARSLTLGLKKCLEDAFSRVAGTGHGLA